MKEIIIFGNGPIAEVAYFYFKNDSPYTVAAFCVDYHYLESDTFCNLPCVAYESIEKNYPPEKFAFFAALSYANLNSFRSEKYLDAKEKGYEIVSYISSKATIWIDLSKHENCFILEDNTVQPFAKIGNNVTLWSGNHVGHHSIIEDNCFITSHTVISGEAVIGKNSFVGVNSTIRNAVKIGENNVIGAGAIIMESTENNSVYVPESTVRSRVPSNRLRKI